LSHCEAFRGAPTQNLWGVSGQCPRPTRRSGAQAYLVKPVKPEEIEQAVAKLTSPLSAKDSEAWSAEIAVVREELAIRYRENAELKGKVREKRLRAEEKLMRLKAEKTFLDAGGARGKFARRWPSVFTLVARGQRKSDAASGH
jgi:response regulator RpfG family c-di-GMP phosphodiesterase